MKVLVGTKQFKMVIDESLIDRLRHTAQRTGRDSAQHVAEEIIEFYLPIYTAVFDATRRAIAYQSERQISDQIPMVARDRDGRKWTHNGLEDEIPAADINVTDPTLNTDKKTG